MTQKQRTIILQALEVCEIYVYNDLQRYEHTPQWAYDVAKRHLTMVKEAIGEMKKAK